MAASAQATDLFGDDTSNCLICLDGFKSPKLLPCLHSFCLDCIQRHHETYKLQNAGQLTCPTCREPLCVPEEGVNGFKDDTTARTIKLLQTGINSNHGFSSKEITDKVVLDALRCDVTDAVSGLQQSLTQLRSTLLQLHHVENHILEAMRMEKQLQVEEGLVQEKSRQSISALDAEHVASLAAILKRQEELYKSYEELQSTRTILESFLQEGSEADFQACSMKIQRMLSETLPFLERFSPKHSAKDKNNGIQDLLGDFDMTELAEKLIPKYKNPSEESSKKGKFSFRRKKAKDKLEAELITVIGDRGMDIGRFDFPVHVSFLPNGSFMVCDNHNQRIQVFDTNGKFQREFLKKDVQPRRAHLNLQDGLIYVTDDMSECIKAFTVDGKFVSRIGEKLFQCPAGLDIDKNGNVIATDSEKCLLTVHRPNGELILRKYVGCITDKVIPNPYYSTTNDDDQLIVSDFRNNLVRVYESTGKLAFEITKLVCPRGIAVDPYGNILIAEGDRHCVSMYSPHGKFIQDVVTERDGLRFPLSIDVSATGQLAVAQCGYYSPHQVLLFQVY